MKESRATGYEDEEFDGADVDTDDRRREEVDTEDSSDPTVRWFPASSHARWEEKTEMAAVVAEELYGVEVNPAYPVVAGSGFTAEQWVECLVEAEYRM